MKYKNLRLFKTSFVAKNNEFVVMKFKQYSLEDIIIQLIKKNVIISK